jgi:hypothetical protein
MLLSQFFRSGAHLRMTSLPSTEQVKINPNGRSLQENFFTGGGLGASGLGCSSTAGGEEASSTCGGGATTDFAILRRMADVVRGDAAGWDAADCGASGTVAGAAGVAGDTGAAGIAGVAVVASLGGEIVGAGVTGAGGMAAD